MIENISINTLASFLLSNGQATIAIKDLNMNTFNTLTFPKLTKAGSEPGALDNLLLEFARRSLNELWSVQQSADLLANRLEEDLRGLAPTNAFKAVV